MKLSKYQIQLMKRVRELVEFGRRFNAFICLSIAQAAEEFGEPKQDLIEAIEQAIFPHHTFDCWFTQQSGIFVEGCDFDDGLEAAAASSRFDMVEHPMQGEFRELTKQARLAWLDRIIETGEIN
ncbi:hypothetical protein [Burkholderia phage BCSR52]|uniref:Uncharacterized protein n=1 Tax=Burkholderia phage BCSR52 TaxID=2805748 RepID=A0A889IQA0_9CAUD|nr:hypothetical protein [Burkholderia phage BCSR52]